MGRWMMYNSWTTPPYSGLYAVRCAGFSSDTNEILTTPWLDLSGMFDVYGRFDCSLVFMQLRTPNTTTGYVDSLTVLMRTSDTSDWQVMATYGSTALVWTETIVPLSVYIDSCQVAFKYTPRGGQLFVIDDVYIGKATSCHKVTGLGMVSVTADTVVIAWRDTINVGATYTVRCWDDAGDTIQIITSDTMATVAGLGGCTMYHFEVTAGCTDTTRSMPVVFNQRTAAGLVHIPFTERFDGLMGTPTCLQELSGSRKPQ